MRLNMGAAWVGFLFLLAYSWVIFCEENCGTFHMRCDSKTIQNGANKAIVDSNIMGELYENASKAQGNAKMVKGIKGLKVKDMRPPNVTVDYLPDEGTRMCIISQLTVGGKSFIGGPMEITVKNNMSILCEIKKNTKKELEIDLKKCRVDLISCKTNLPSSMLPKIVAKFLNSTLTKVMPGMMCPAAEKVVKVMEKMTSSSWQKQPIGDRGAIEYKLCKDPKITQDGAMLQLETVIHKKNGDKIEMPQRAKMPKEMPPKKEGFTDVLISADYMDALMELFADDFRCDVNKAKVSSLTIGKLAKMIPSISKSQPASKAVKAEIRLKEPVKHSLGPNGSYMTVHSSVNLIAEPKGKILFSFEMCVVYQPVIVADVHDGNGDDFPDENSDEFD
nr:PREDICTED: BPI fold-containing family B member 6 [Anolis carolinensis]|eukprot:XP_016853075.1 PREDICTED: BPI fold-containing family B member 6 [Anolis carolinensis]